ncbi:MAG: DUF3014 domain-containing protein [Gammaproteobacteria bacterium]
MSLRNITITIVVIAVLAGAAFFFYSRPAGQKAETPLEPATVPPVPEVAAPGPEPEPVFTEAEVAEPPAPLPALESSDAEAREAVTRLAGRDFVERFLVPDSVVRKVVATVDNVPRQKLDMRIRAVPALGGRFLVAGTEDDIVLHPDNFDRYTPFVSLVAGIDPARVADVYVRFYPLLQQAYQELGYPDQQFHNRLLEVIDHLLATPEVPTPIRLVRPHVLYHYADPDLESRSAGQKALIRMGPANVAAIKDALRAFRVELRSRTEPGAGT